MYSASFILTWKFETTESRIVKDSEEQESRQVRSWWLVAPVNMRGLVRHKALADTYTNKTSGLTNVAGVTASTKQVTH